MSATASFSKLEVATPQIVMEGGTAMTEDGIALVELVGEYSEGDFRRCLIVTQQFDQCATWDLLAIMDRASITSVRLTCGYRQ